MKRDLIAIVLLINVVFLSITSCVTTPTNTVSISEKYASKLEAEGGEQADIIMLRTAHSKKDLSYYAYQVMRVAKIYSNVYSKIAANLEDTNNDLMSSFEAAESIIQLHYNVIGSNWRLSINNSVEYPDSCVGFEMAVALMEGEFISHGTVESAGKMRTAFKNRIVSLESESHSKTLETYSIVSQMIDHVCSPSGSLTSYSATMNQLKNDFQRAITLAELEL